MKLLLCIPLNLILFLCCLSTEESQPFQQARITPGAERTVLYFDKLEGKRIGLAVNNTSRIGQTHLVDSLMSAGFNIQRVFAPEHGFKGAEDAGAKIKDGKIEGTDINIISLYGSKSKPAKEDLEDIDLMIFDIQDVGVRFYTYLSTLHLVMEACAENNIKVIVLDRPNPLGHYIDGPVLQESNKSFVGMHPVPVVYGMTIGEYALMINGEKWLENEIQADLEIIPADNYTHKSRYVVPIKPSPNLPNNIAIGHYPSLCLFEGTTVSVGRGTDKPFQIVGHPALEEEKYSFTPSSKPGASKPKHKDKTCYGLDLSRVAPQKKFDLTHLKYFHDKLKGQGETFFNENNFFDLLAGTNELRKQLSDGLSIESIKASWKEDLEAFKVVRQQYLMYD